MIHLDEKLDKKKLENAILIGVWGRMVSREKAEEYLDELRLLTDTAGAVVKKVYLQKMDAINSATYVGKGKLEEIKAWIDANGIDLVVFDDDLSPSQIKNIDRVLNTKTLDRSGIILHIFSERARSAQAKAQVELAHLQYMLPRLVGLWSHLEKQRGGIGMKGAGEKEIETDRRIIRRKIDALREELKKIDKQATTRRKGREQVVRAALVGYTNVGKSTLMNLLAKSGVLAENKLFATLDTTTRKVVWNQIPFLLSDTVGFIRKLPHNLIECFKSTLDEVREADILLHVVDVSHPAFEEQLAVVTQTLHEIGAQDKPTVVVFNKTDRLEAEVRDHLQSSWYARANHPAVFISAEQKDGIDSLRKTLLRLVREKYGDRYPGLPDGVDFIEEEPEAGDAEA